MIDFKNSAALAIAMTALGFLSTVQAADLKALLDSASPGDTILVSAGEHGSPDLRNYAFTPAVTLAFDDGAHLTKLILRDVEGITFEGLTISPGAAKNPKSEKAIYIQRGGNLTFRNINVYWTDNENPLDDAFGLYADGTDGLSIERGNFHNSRTGIFIKSAANVTISGSRFADILADGIAVAGTTNLTITDNLCQDFAARGDTGVHPDCIQLQAGGQAVPVNNALITRNLSLKGFGDKAQGIFVKSRHAGVPHSDIVIEDNVIKQSIGLGIYGENVMGLTIRNNLVTPAFEAIEPPRILVRDPSQNVVVEGNTAWRVSVPAQAVSSDNVELETQ